jgi:hypothetical protein
VSPSLGPPGWPRGLQQLKLRPFFGMANRLVMVSNCCRFKLYYRSHFSPESSVFGHRLDYLPCVCLVKLSNLILETPTLGPSGGSSAPRTLRVPVNCFSGKYIGFSTKCVSNSAYFDVNRLLLALSIQFLVWDNTRPEYPADYSLPAIHKHLEFTWDIVVSPTMYRNRIRTGLTHVLKTCSFVVRLIWFERQMLLSCIKAYWVT